MMSSFYCFNSYDIVFLDETTDIFIYCSNYLVIFFITSNDIK